MNTEDLFTRALADVQQGRGSLDEVLAHYPEARAELASLMRLALHLEALRDNPEALPAPAARARMWERIAAELPPVADEHRAAPPVYQNGYHADPAPLLRFPARPRGAWAGLGRRVAAMAASLALFMGVAGVGTVSAARDSLPGDFLYPVKTVAEQAEIALAFSDADRASVYMSLAERRLWELAQVSEIGKPDVASQLAQAYDRHLDEAASSAARAAIEGKSPLPASQVESQLVQQQQALLDLSKRVSQPVQEAVAVALSAVNQAAGRLSLAVNAPPPTGAAASASAPLDPSLAASASVAPPETEPVVPQAGPNGGGGIFSEPTVSGGGSGFPTDKDRATATATPTPGKGLLPIAPSSPGPTHTGDGAAPVAPVAAGSSPTAEPSASEEPQATPSSSPTPDQSPAPTPEPSGTPTPDKPEVISPPPAPTSTADGKDGTLGQPTPPLQPRIIGPSESK
ncbi:MAG: hypothetical protein HY689_08795 [Chloroflexi bacterium]|nr:hypothetical protein [Chloroflexota bacterium]